MKKVGIYVHIPFCKQKCFYCDFVSYCGKTKFVDKYISPDAPGRKEHIGYIIDRVGFEEYKKWALEGVELMPETIMKNNIYWNGIHFDR